MVIRTALAACAVVVFAARGAEAAPFLLDFEGLQNIEAVLDFYNGGTGSAGSAGTNFGVSFSGSGIAAIDTDAGGSGMFGNEPSPSTTMFVTGSGLTASLVMNVSGGFDTGLAWFLTSADNEGTVEVYDGSDGTGSLLASGGLPITNPGCGGDPTGIYNCWVGGSLGFAGVARSVVFTGPRDRFAFDNITVGSTDPIDNPVPEPATLVLVGSGIAAAAANRRRRARQVSQS